MRVMLLALLILVLTIVSCGSHGYYGQVVAIEGNNYLIANMYRGTVNIDHVPRKGTNFKVGDCVAYNLYGVSQVVLCTDLIMR